MKEEAEKRAISNAILDGIRVVDWTVFQAGPIGTAMLGDLGADVLHVEPRLVGETQRTVTSVFGVSLKLPHNRTANFEVFNRNKRGIALDLAKPEGPEIMHQLVRNSDVFVTNYRESAVAKYGLDYETLCKANPRIVYVRISGSGRKGPEVNKPSVDLVAQAKAGIMLSSRGSNRDPVALSVGIGDTAAAMMLAYGVMAALFWRERSGVGQEIHVSVLNSLLALQTDDFAAKLFTGRELEALNRENTDCPLYSYYRCKDGKWIALGMLQDRYWPITCEALGVPELINDPRFKDAGARKQAKEELIPILDGVFASKTSEEWQIILERFDLVFNPVCSISELCSDEQVLANDYIMNFTHPVLGSVKHLGFPVEFSKTPGILRLPAPDLGQHTEEVLSEVCGYSKEKIGSLKELEVI